MLALHEWEACSEIAHASVGLERETRMTAKLEIAATFRSDYEQEIEYEYDFSIPVNRLYYIDKSALVENRPLVKFIRNYIRDSSGVFSISSLVRISMTSFLAFTLLFVQKHSCLYNKKKITQRLEDMNFIFSW